ncbi:phospho-N-acetylmuramoyl-pentapeptide-transferase [uncultured Gammaproteobacteria bacterium]
MFYNLLFPLSDEFGPFNLFRYITFRTGGAILTALTISFVIGPKLIRWLKAKQGEGQPIRSDGPETHFKKKGTPTMGGLMILIAVIISTLLWADITNPYIWIVLMVTVGFGAVGFGDDYLKLTKRNPKGLNGRLKLIAQSTLALIAAILIVLVTPEPLATKLAVPVFKNVLINLGIFFVFAAALVMVGASNAVNLTDGLDGLAIVPAMMAAACFGFIAYLSGNINFSNYLQIHYIPGTGEHPIGWFGLDGSLFSGQYPVG